MTSGDFPVARGGECMDCDPNQIARKIAQYQDEIDDFTMQIQKRRRWIAELMCLWICDDEGNVISFANWNF
ncbi:hypothetical protein [uncultured Nostoc sp.]|uniref:hypothetical protein n=1 Tax=uncultured Nostoc sp. TaxID=340711 RepID=UPI0035CBF650